MAARFFGFLIEIPLVWLILWLGLATLTGALLALTRSRWGQNRPLRKCAVLSLLAHVLLACLAASVRIVAGVSGPPAPPVTRVTIVVSDEEQPEAAGTVGPDSWRVPTDRLPGPPHAQPVSPADPENVTAPTAPPDIADSVRPPHETTASGPERPDTEPDSEVPDTDTAAAERTEAMPAAAEPVETPRPEPQLPEVSPPMVPVTAPAPALETLKQPAVSPSTPEATAPAQPPAESEGHASAPTIFRNRLAPDRARVVDANGGDAKTEAAVQAALRWLADNQSPDGRWAPELHGAGQEHVVLGQNRQRAGARADTGMTGLALLAFLSAGETHMSGNHQPTVRSGLSYLTREQANDGRLGGRANVYAHMYCHAMATFALSEAYAMTGDRQLDTAVRLAVGYSLAAQNPVTGGWRYQPWRLQPWDPGDTSQLGWQAMALKSAELAGINVPRATWDGAERFLAAVAAGPYGGLASYQPRSAPSRTMTAEALACHRLLGTLQSPEAAREAADYLLAQLPGDGQPNLYYWYYATLAMYQLQGDAWQRWNEALKATLVNSQRTFGHLAGSWDADCVWGGYGGRVYSTAMAALSLEVYYRYLPVYVEAARRNSQLR